MTEPTVRFTIAISEDDLLLDGAFDTGDPEADRAQAAELRERLTRGDTWAWAYVTVTGEYTDPKLGTFTASDSLGGCSYADEAGFRAGGYFEDMCDTIRRDIADQVKHLTLIGGTGELFTRAEHRQLAALIHKRFGRDIHATTAAWRRLLQNSATSGELNRLLAPGLV